MEVPRLWLTLPGEEHPMAIDHFDDHDQWQAEEEVEEERSLCRPHKYSNPVISIPIVGHPESTNSHARTTSKKDLVCSLSTSSSSDSDSNGHETDLTEKVMQRIWQWLRDRKTNTLRKWRSSGASVGGSNGAVADSNGQLNSGGREKRKKRKSASEANLHRNTASTGSMPATIEACGRKPSDYEDFFNETEPAINLHRRPSNRSPILDPVQAPDAPDADQRNTNWLEREKRPSPAATPTLPPRSPRIIRFNIPEVQVSFEEDEPQSLFVPHRQRSASPQPAAELDWSPAIRPYSASPTVMLPGYSRSVDETALSRANTQHVSLTAEDIMSCTTVQRTGSERPNRRQSSAAAMRRQSTVQVAQTISGRRSSTTLIPLTFPQIHLIRTLWRQIYVTKGPTVIGTSIFHRLCFKSAELKDQIRASPLPPQFNNHDEFIKAHCKAVADLIDQVVENLDNLDVMTEELMRVGRVHAKLTKGGPTGKMWNFVAETFIDCTLEWGDRRCRSETVRKAWALIIAFMIEKIKSGHHEQRKLMLSARASMSQLDGLPLHNLRIA